MQSLDEKEWKAVKLDSMADISSGRDIYAQERVAGNMPYVTAGTANNGIGYFVGNSNDSIDKNIISVNRNGAVGEAFYHPYNALFGNDCRRVSLRETKDANAQIFVAHSISCQKKAFSYSRKLGTARLKRLQVMLPVDDTCNPDYEYMAEYVRQKRDAMLEKYHKYVEARVAKLGELVEIPALNEKEWAGFQIGDVFETNTHGKKTYMPTGALVDVNRIGSGTIPRIRVTAQNNGINGFTKDSDDSSFRTFENFVSVSFLGSSFYHPYTASLDMKVHCLKFRKREMNVFLGL